MKEQIMMTGTPELKFFPNTGSDDFDRTCPYCGQGKTLFNLGACICGKQAGCIQYVKNPKKYAKNWYSYIGIPKIGKSEDAEIDD